jgi:hypothetical protein
MSGVVAFETENVSFRLRNVSVRLRNVSFMRRAEAEFPPSAQTLFSEAAAPPPTVRTQALDNNRHTKQT